MSKKALPYPYPRVLDRVDRQLNQALRELHRTILIATYGYKGFQEGPFPRRNTPVLPCLSVSADNYTLRLHFWYNFLHLAQ